MTILLGVVLEYVYASVGYFYLVDSFYNSDFGPSGENQCMNVFQCFMTMFSLGPRSSGGIGDMMRRESYEQGNRKYYYVRFFFDVTCFLVINIIIMNIIFGIIIDTFSEMRQENKKIELNKQNVCFICSLNKTRVIFSIL